MSAMRDLEVLMAITTCTYTLSRDRDKATRNKQRVESRRMSPRDAILFLPADARIAYRRTINSRGVSSARVGRKKRITN